jgi:CDP-diacylglycerol--glycerol-3-phosphate 3-phosphatidyltransferase
MAGGAGPQGGKPRLWNVANLLTMTRLVLVPGFVLLLVHGDGHDPAWRSFAWAAFAVAMITDLFDGELARRYGLVTDFGKIADPIADKAIMGAALIGLSGLGDLPWWVTAVILFRELGITLMRFWVIRHGVIPASRGGKLKTLTQGVAVGMYILVLTGPLASLRAWLMAAAVVLTVATGLDYVRQAVVLRRAGLAAERAAARGDGAAGPDGAAGSGAQGAGEGAAGSAAEGGAAAGVEPAGSTGPAAEALRLLEERGWTLAVAESLTGGLLAAELTGVPGASRSFRGSVTAYATPLKEQLLGVDGALLAARGAVDPDVARQMALGVRDRLGADWGAATTGVAGPDPQDGQPVGTVFVAVAGPDGSVQVAPLLLAGDRTAIRRASVGAVLDLLLEQLRKTFE